MSASEPIIARPRPQGRPADKIAAGFAGAGLTASVMATMWFFLGFYETDPGFSPASSAFLLSMGLGAFAIIPSAVILRLTWTSWRQGFQRAHGLWTLLLALPWLVLAGIALPSDWLSFWFSLIPILIALPLSFWAVVSLILDARDP